MQAWVLEAAKQPLVLKDVTDPVAGPGQAVVTFRAAALNHRDLWLQQGDYFVSKYPVTLGGDGAGKVTSIGHGVDANWLGADVIVNPGVGWGGSEATANADFRTLGTPEDGTFAEQIVISIEQLHRKPAHLDFVQAAALPLSGVTGYRALFSRGRLSPGEAVLITGVGGGVAQFMLQFAVATGARVFVTSGSDDKIARARAMGAAGGANYRQATWVDDLRRQAREGFDLIVDSACGLDFGSFVDLAAPGGRIVYFGLTAGPAPALDMRAFYRKQLSLLGTKMGSRADFAAMVDFVGRHLLVPEIDRVMGFADINAALALLDTGHQVGKIAFDYSRQSDQQ